MLGNINVTAALKPNVLRNQADYVLEDDEYYVLEDDYGAGTRGDRISKGPALIGDGFPCLKNTVFEKQGIDSFHDDEAYLFKGDQHARLKFTPCTTNDQLRWSGDIKGAWPNLGSFLPCNPVNLPQQPPPNNNNQAQVATSISITNETRTGTLNFEDSKDWFGYNTRKGGYPRTIEDNQTRKFTHQGKVNGKKYGSMGAVIYVGPGEVRGDSDDCGWLIAWHIPGNNNQNHVYVDTGYRDKFDDIDWDGIQYKLRTTGTSQQYIDPHSKTGVYARIPNSGNKKIYDLNVYFRAGGR